MVLESYIKVGDDFVPINDFVGPVKDPEYIEGAIELTVNGVRLISVEMWNYVDQLWEYLVDSVADAVAGREASVFFPDQPIEIRIRPAWGGAGIDLEVVSGGVSTRTAVDLDSFLAAFRAAGTSFFRKMREANPGNEEADERVLQKLAELGNDRS